MPDRDDDGVDALRTRVHKLADVVHGHEGTLREHVVRLSVVQERVDRLDAHVATRDQVNQVALAMTAQIQAFHTQNTLRLDHVVATLDPLRKAVYWAASLIVGAVGLALLGLALKSNLIP